MYLDLNNLYGYVMLKFLPTSGFKRINPIKFYSKKKKKKYSSNSLTGFVSEVHLEYLKELYNLHNDYSLVPDKIEIKQRKFSKYQLIIFDFHNW